MIIDNLSILNIDFRYEMCHESGSVKGDRLQKYRFLEENLWGNNELQSIILLVLIDRLYHE